MSCVPQLIIGVLGASVGEVFRTFGQNVKRIHGGPPVVFVNAKALRSNPATQAATANMTNHYLGVLHFWVPVPPSGRQYKHYLYRMAPEPPFQVTQVCAE